MRLNSQGRRPWRSGLVLFLLIDFVQLSPGRFDSYRCCVWCGIHFPSLISYFHTYLPARFKRFDGKQRYNLGTHYCKK